MSGLTTWICSFSRKYPCGSTKHKQTKTPVLKRWFGGFSMLCILQTCIVLGDTPHSERLELELSARYLHLCLTFFFFPLNTLRRFKDTCFSLVERNTSRLWAGTSALPYFPHRLPLIPLLAVLFARPTFLLGVPRLAQRALLSSAGVAQGLAGAQQPCWGHCTHFCAPGLCPWDLAHPPLIDETQAKGAGSAERTMLSKSKRGGNKTLLTMSC